MSNKVPLKSHCLSNRLLTKSTFAKIFTICFFFVEETFDHVLGNKVDHVSLMFISEHQCKYGTQNKCLQILFFNNPTKFFFLIPKVCVTASVFHFLKLVYGYLFEEIYALNALYLWRLWTLPYESYSTDANLLRMVMVMVWVTRGYKGYKIIFLKQRCYRPTKRQFPLELLQQSISGKDRWMDH